MAALRADRELRLAGAPPLLADGAGGVAAAAEVDVATALLDVTIRLHLVPIEVQDRFRGCHALELCRRDLQPEERRPDVDVGALGLTVVEQRRGARIDRQP